MGHLARTPIRDFEVARRRMVAEQLVARGITDGRILEVMSAIPRHLFVEEAFVDFAYGDFPVGIGEGQTISQPFIVALMTQALLLTGRERVLEIGTGCGYQTAILASLVAQVYTVERVKLLALKARRILKEGGYRNIVLRVGDGTDGWPTMAPFDAILVAAGSPTMPQPLLHQLAEGGRLVIPIGSSEEQELVRVTKRGGRMLEEKLGACRFVPLVGKFGWHPKNPLQKNR